MFQPDNFKDTRPVVFQIGDTLGNVLDMFITENWAPQYSGYPSLTHDGKIIVAGACAAQTPITMIFMPCGCCLNLN
jgi:hypothetical protein